VPAADRGWVLPPGESFADANDIPVVTLKAADRNIEVMRPYLDKAAASGRSQVAAIGVAQEVQRVFLARQRDTDRSKPPQFSFDFCWAAWFAATCRGVTRNHSPGPATE
jgi:hypothetical protein